MLNNTLIVNRALFKVMVLNNAVYRKLDIEMSLNNIKLTANCFALTHPENEKNLFKYIFREMFKRNKVETFCSAKVIFFTDGKHIYLRTCVSDVKIPMAKEYIEFSHGQQITGKIMVPLNRECSFNRQEIEEYISVHGEKPKGNSGKKRKNLTADEAAEFTKNALSSKGLLDVTIIEQQCGPQLSILNIPVQTRDISFSATVGDLVLFKTAWLNGIGRDKTYGFGMIRLDGTLFTPPCNNSAHA